jgi:hypothetical protein
MEEKTFYRLEAQDGKGPYTTEIKTNLLLRMREEHDRIASEEESRTPSVSSDMWHWFIRSIIKEGQLHLPKLFGFVSEEQMKKWFTIEELMMLLDNGFNIKEYQSKEYTFDDKQAIFIPLTRESP